MGRFSARRQFHRDRWELALAALWPCRFAWLSPEPETTRGILVRAVQWLAASRDPAERPCLVLGPRMASAHGHRYGVLSKPELSHCAGQVRDTRLRLHGGTGPKSRICGRSDVTCGMKHRRGVLVFGHYKVTRPSNIAARRSKERRARWVLGRMAHDESGPSLGARPVARCAPGALPFGGRWCPPSMVPPGRECAGSGILTPSSGLSKAEFDLPVLSG